MTTIEKIDTSTISVTASAVEKIKEILLEPDNDGKNLRIYVQGGGCSGMSYGFSVDDQQEDDFVHEEQGTKILIDSMSMQYLMGSVIDWVEDLYGAQFTIDNPHAETTCGCGSSFSPY